MTAVKEISRPSSSHRPFFSTANSLPGRQAGTRSNSHSTPLGSFGAAHRVTRRKSSTLTPAAITSLRNLVEGEDDGKQIAGANRRSVSSKIALGSLNAGSYPSPPNSLPQHHHTSVPDALQYGRLDAASGSALIDGPSLASLAAKSERARIRRASDGSTLSSKKKSGHGDLKCETCGKGYKHSSCLTKHLWEHTPEWAITSKLLISKHQQVQLLEAASVLVAMNIDADVAKTSDSDQSSASPAASGSSDHDDAISSAETSPPPQGEAVYGHRKQHSTASSGYSRSYQSVFSTSEGLTSPRDYQHRRQWSTSSNRPATAGTSIAESYPGEDQADLAAAVGLLSCSYGTPQTGPTHLSADIPPVPPLPARYQSYRSGSVVMGAGAGPSPAQHIEDAQMEIESSSEDNESVHYASHRYSRTEDEDGIFGKMEE